MGSSLIPTESWPPYRALWSRWLVLSRDAEGNPRPWTHGMRAHWLTFVLVVALVVVACAWWARRAWPVVIAFAAGALFGHVVWAGQPLGAVTGCALH